jgi:hypothetical protein
MSLMLVPSLGDCAPILGVLDDVDGSRWEVLNHCLPSGEIVILDDADVIEPISARECVCLCLVCGARTIATFSSWHKLSFRLGIVRMRMAIGFA